jgi:hypothetical protein
MNSLRENYERNVHKALFLTRELIQILDCAAGMGIELVPYKGVVLSEVYYGDMAARAGGDLDLFVRAKDVGRVKSAVRELGFVSRVAIPEPAEADYIAAGYEWTFDSPAGRNLLELQWALQPRFYAVDFEMEGLFGRAVPVSLAERILKTPSPEDLLLVLSIHAAKHVWARLIWLCDIARVVERELDWKWIREQAQELGIERILHVTLLLTNRLWAMEVPAEIEEAVERDFAARRFAEQVAVSFAAGVEYEEEKMSYFRLMMRLREKPSDRVRFMTRLVLTPGPGEWGAVRLPRALFPFYRVVRMARLIGRLARG